ncbi:MAG: hypothetical protein AAB355_01270 [Patescibacteria group bacterium]
MPRVRLEKIPQEIQQRYNIGEEVEADVGFDVTAGGKLHLPKQERERGACRCSGALRHPYHGPRPLNDSRLARASRGLFL